MREKTALPETDTPRAASATDEAAATPATHAADRREPRELLLMRAGEFRIALFADEVESVSDALPPTPLPHAPRSVLGVVSLRGRIRTLIDPRPLLASETIDEHDANHPDHPDTNLLLTRDDVNSPETDNPDADAPGADAPDADAHDADDTDAAAHDADCDNAPTASLLSVMVALRGDEQLALAVQCIESHIEISPADIETPATPVNHVRGTLLHDRATIIVLHPSHLFEAAMQGTDRRRQRS